MRRALLTLIFAMIISILSFGAGLTGIKNIPGDYSNVNNAIIERIHQVLNKIIHFLWIFIVCIIIRK